MPLAEDDRLSTIGDKGRRLWLYTDRVWGAWLKRRTVVAWLLFFVLLLAPWIDVKGDPALMFDIPNRKFHIFGMTLLASDGLYLLFLMGFVVFGIFLVTALFGRAWCGWACPQTVFLESIIRPLETLIEGKPRTREKLDASPTTLNKVWKKALKYSVYLVVSGAVATTVVAYFLGRDGVLDAQFDPFSHPAGTGFFIGITLVLFFDFAWFREQTCVVVCPYGRFQSVLLDADSISVNYDTQRGEPRGKKGTPGAADCIDCKRCIQVCPTGIDIRKGTQMECVACMACIDACDEVMDVVGRPRGLVRFASLNELEGRPTRKLRPRVVVYSVLIAVVATGLYATLGSRRELEFTLARAPGPVYIEMPDGMVQNHANLRISNRGDADHVINVEVLDPPDGKMVVPGIPVIVKAGHEQRLPAFLMRPTPKTPDGKSKFRVRISDERAFEQIIEWNFLSKAQM
jgi:cytochrome c oxidase accessory protein FixG